MHREICDGEELTISGMTVKKTPKKSTTADDDVRDGQTERRTCWEVEVELESVEDPFLHVKEIISLISVERTEGR
jgi:hypothetical protein